MKGPWYSLDRAVDTTGQTKDCLRTEQRDAQAATRWLTTAIRRHGVPQKITMDGRAAHTAALERDNTVHGLTIAIPQTTYLHKMGEQEHRATTRVTRPMRGCTAFAAAQGT